MEIKQYDKVLLTSGETASIVEILAEGKDYIADIDREDGSIDTEFLYQKDIESIVK